MAKKNETKQDEPKPLVKPVPAATRYFRGFYVEQVVEEHRHPLVGTLMGYELRTLIRSTNSIVSSLIIAGTRNHDYPNKGCPVLAAVRSTGAMVKWAERSGYHTSAEYQDFMNFLKGEAQKIAEEAKDRTDAGFVAFDDLWSMFGVGTEVVIDNDPMMAGEVVGIDLETGWFGTQFLKITIQTISVESGKPNLSKKSTSIFKYHGVCQKQELGVRLLKPEEKAALSERGKLFRKAAKEASYMNYNGYLVRRSWWGDTEIRADGRCMMDVQMMKKTDPDYFRRYRGYDEDESKEESYNIPDDKLWMCEPWMFGFSLTTKKWGEFRVDGLTEVKFKKDAYTKLVMDETKKKTILALVQNNGGAFADLIEGKGGGCIFLLHGPPGTGKTLTAEAVAEVLERPLYSVSVGELGTDPEHLEGALRKILEVSMAWNAVILLDEADIFLEARDENNIVRNAMVGIFLRLLEYHQGVMFLTTNRVRQFDKAFHSRVSVAINYPAMDDTTREKVWKNLLDAAGLKGLDAKRLCKHDINGRQIKNVIRLAQTLAKSEGRPVAVTDIESMITVARDFTTDLATGTDPV